MPRFATLAAALLCWLPPSLLASKATLPRASAPAIQRADAWLQYHPQTAPALQSVPGLIAVGSPDPVVQTAAAELGRGLARMLGRTVRLEPASAALRTGERLVILGTWPDVRTLAPGAAPPGTAGEDSFWTAVLPGGSLAIVGYHPRAVLDGAFAALRDVALGRDPRRARVETPAAPIRWVNQWDNLDGTIERGYAGPSIFFADGRVRPDLSRVREYGRLLASVGINGCTINNVNADARIITDAFLPELARVAEALRPWGVRLSIAVDFSSPRKIGGLDTFDPLDPRVAAFWRARVDAIYRAVPDLGGFVLKADSEGRLGPSAYGRTHADAANVIARALKPHGGILLYRGFVYDHKMDWRDRRNDRAKAAYDNFAALDGAFDPNVVLQIKHGPIDFQVREPASPLFAALRRTNQAIELQITQEYLGQQRHAVYIGPMWQDVLDFDMHAEGPRTFVRELVTGRTFDRPLGGFVGVANVGLADNWLAHDLALANLYAFGRLAWDPALRTDDIAREWTRLTFGHDERVVTGVTGILMDSWPAYENYTGPLGAGTLTDIIHVHYGPGVESSERNGWGQWHRADARGIGMDRTVATGTAFIAQYPPPVAQRFESLETCPDELLLFMHHVPYTHVLQSGKTVIQHIYDTHYTGAETAAGFVDRWRTLAGRIDPAVYADVAGRLEYQAGHAVVWRDAVCQWFRRTSGIPDALGRVDRVPGRLEAEDATARGYAPVEITPWETASRGKAMACTVPDGCALEWTLESRTGGLSDVHVLYYDERDGASRFRLLLDGRLVTEWVADDGLPTDGPNGHSATRRRIEAVQVPPGARIRLEAVPDAGEQAVVDYVEIGPRQAGSTR